MNTGAWQDISAKIGNFAPRGSKILSEVITFVLKSILDTQVVQRLPWLPPAAGSEQSQL